MRRPLVVAFAFGLLLLMAVVGSGSFVRLTEIREQNGTWETRRKILGFIPLVTVRLAPAPLGAEVFAQMAEAGLRNVDGVQLSGSGQTYWKTTRPQGTSYALSCPTVQTDVAKALAFYRSQLRAVTAFRLPDGETMIEGRTPRGDQVSVTIRPRLGALRKAPQAAGISIGITPRA